MKIHAGNLAATTTEDDLRTAFAAHGTVDSARLAIDKSTGQPKNFGFVEMDKDEEAKAAITALNGSDLGGSSIKVSESQPKTAPEAATPAR